MKRKIRVNLTILTELELTDEQIKKFYDPNNIESSIKSFVEDYVYDVDLWLPKGCVNDYDYEIMEDK